MDNAHINSKHRLMPNVANCESDALGQASTRRNVTQNLRSSFIQGR
jgi:hypothetical protein